MAIINRILGEDGKFVNVVKDVVTAKAKVSSPANFANNTISEETVVVTQDQLQELTIEVVADLTKVELKVLAEERDIKVSKRATRADIIDLLIPSDL
jgi:hypothetical protein